MVAVSEPPLAVVVAPGAESATLVHNCGAAGAAVATLYTIRPGVAERLERGERVPVTARCHGCGGRVFANLVGPRGETAPRRAPIVRFDPSPSPSRASESAPRGPAYGPTRRPGPVRRPGAASPIPLDRYRRAPPPVGEETQPKVEVCPACGTRPDGMGRCRCSL